MGICEVAFAGTAIFSREPAGAAAWLGLVFWWGLQWGSAGASSAIARPLAMAAGLALIGEAIAGYADWGAMTDRSFLGACVMAAAFAVAGRRVMPSRREPENVLTVAGAVVPGEEATASRGAVPLELAVAQSKPRRIVAGAREWEQHASPRFLLDCKLSGVRLETDAVLEQRLLERISPASLQPMDLLWSEPLRQARPAMAIQSVYSNVIGLALLAVLAPLLLLIAFAARLSAGPGPLFEKVECAGFQGVPFFRRGFRIQHPDTGEVTGIGRLLGRLRLRGLPQLINVVRGEMGLFGPQPVRAVFAHYLDHLSPVFSRRLSLKPGVFGWAQAHGGWARAHGGWAQAHGGPSAAAGIPLAGEIQEEALRIAYDLYYLEFGSPLMDLEILGRTLLRPWLPARRR